MAIQKPFGINIRGTAIDGNESNIIQWRVTGDTSVAFSIEIKNNEDGTVAFSLPKTNSSEVKYALQSDSLVNGNEYKIAITVWDINGNSTTSDPVIFSTSSRPVVTITAPTDGIVGSRSYLFSASYSQSESVSMKSWSFYLYDVNKNLISQSEINTSTTIEHLYENLGYDDTYYVEFKVTSSKGLTGTTGLVQFKVEYTRPHASLSMSAENTNDGGVHLKWFVNQVTGQSVNASFINNEKLDVTNGIVTFDQGINVRDTFTLKLWVENLPDTIIEDVPRVVVSSATNFNIANAIWIEDANATTERTLQIVASSTPPTDPEVLWIEDPNANGEVLTFAIQSNEPSSSNLWIPDDYSYDDAALTTMEGDEGHLSLECFNGLLHLFEVVNGVRTELAQCPVFEGGNFVYIQQKETGYVINAEQIGVV